MDIAIVTGGGSGLGRAFAVGLADAGFGVVVADADRAAAEETAALLPTPSGAVVADLRDHDRMADLVRAAEERGGPHVLVNNVGGWTPGGRQFPEAAPQEWLGTIALDLTAPMLLTQLVLEPMRRLGGGAVLTISSSAGIGNGPYGSPEYAATKAALIRLTSSLAGLGETHGVRATCIVPDWIGLPRAHEQLAAMPAADRARVRPLVPPGEIVAVGLDLIRDGRAGTIVEMRGGSPPHEQQPYDF